MNLPKVLEAFPDYPEFGGDGSKGSFAEHTQMLQYLRNYTEHYNLRQYIQVNSTWKRINTILKSALHVRDHIEENGYGVEPREAY